MKPPNYELIGKSALLPGLQRILDFVQTEVDLIAGALAANQDDGVGPRKGLRRGTDAYRAYDAQKKRESRMRLKQQQPVASNKSTSLSEQRKAQWATLSPARRKARLAAMLAGKTAKQHLNGEARA